MRFKIFKLLFLLIILLNIGMVKMSHAEEDWPRELKFSCKVLLKDGTKTEISGIYDYPAVYHKKPTVEMDFTMALPSVLVIVKGMATVENNDLLTISKGGIQYGHRNDIRHTFEFRMPDGGMDDGYVIIYAYSCLLCVKIDSSILGTGICRHVYD